MEKKMWLQAPECGHTWSIQSIGDFCVYTELKYFFHTFSKLYRLFLQGDKQDEYWIMIELLGVNEDDPIIFDIWEKAKKSVLIKNYSIVDDFNIILF